MKLKMMQQGGGLIYTPFIPGQTGINAGNSGKSAGSGEEEKLDVLYKELASILPRIKGNPNEIDLITEHIVEILNSAQHLTTLGGAAAYRKLAPQITYLSGEIQKGEFYEKLMTDAGKNIANQHASNEVALDSSGRMYVQDKESGNITFVDPSKYSPDKYLPISYSELAQLRRTDQSLAFNEQTINDIANVVGKDTISKEIDRIIKEYGTKENAKYITSSEAAKRGLITFNSPEAIYKLTQKQQVGDIEDAIAAANELIKQLPSNMVAVLRADAALHGLNPDKETYKVVLDTILRNVNYTETPDYNTDINKAMGIDTDPRKTSSEQLTQNNYLQQLGLMRLYRTHAEIVPRASDVFDEGMMFFSVYNAGAPIDKNRDVLPAMSLAEFRTKAEAVKAGDMNSITFGNHVLAPSEYGAIMYDGSSELNIAMLPYKRDPATGKLTPDFGKITAFNTVRKKLRENPQMSQTELQQLLSSNGLTINDLSGESLEKLELHDVMPFITFSAYGNGDSSVITKSVKPYLEHLENKEGKRIADMFENVLLYGTTHPSKSSRKISNANTPERWDIYRGNVFIPMENAARAMLLSGIGEYIPKSEMTDFAGKVIAREQEVAMRDYLEQNDPNYDLISELAKFK